MFQSSLLLQFEIDHLFNNNWSVYVKHIEQYTHYIVISKLVR